MLLIHDFVILSCPFNLFCVIEFSYEDNTVILLWLNTIFSDRYGCGQPFTLSLTIIILTSQLLNTLNVWEFMLPAPVFWSPCSSTQTQRTPTHKHTHRHEWTCDYREPWFKIFNMDVNAVYWKAFCMLHALFFCRHAEEKYLMPGKTCRDSFTVLRCRDKTNNAKNVWCQFERCYNSPNLHWQTLHLVIVYICLKISTY